MKYCKKSLLVLALFLSFISCRQDPPPPATVDKTSSDTKTSSVAKTPSVAKTSDFTFEPGQFDKTLLAKFLEPITPINVTKITASSSGDVLYEDISWGFDNYEINNLLEVNYPVTVYYTYNDNNKESRKSINLIIKTIPIIGSPIPVSFEQGQFDENMIQNKLDATKSDPSHTITIDEITKSDGDGIDISEINELDEGNHPVTVSYTYDDDSYSKKKVFELKVT